MYPPVSWSNATGLPFFLPSSARRLPSPSQTSLPWYASVGISSPYEGEGGAVLTALTLLSCALLALLLNDRGKTRLYALAGIVLRGDVLCHEHPMSQILVVFDQVEDFLNLEFLSLGVGALDVFGEFVLAQDRKSTRLNSSHVEISYAVFCLK